MTTGGLRKGEKLYEEKLMSEEGMRTTPNKLIFIGRPIPFDTDVFLQKLEGLMRAAYDGREDIIRDLVADVVTTFRPTGEHGCDKENADTDEQTASVSDNDMPKKIAVASEIG